MKTIYLVPLLVLVLLVSGCTSEQVPNSGSNTGLRIECREVKGVEPLRQQKVIGNIPCNDDSDCTIEKMDEYCRSINYSTTFGKVQAIPLFQGETYICDSGKKCRCPDC